MKVIYSLYTNNNFCGFRNKEELLDSLLLSSSMSSNYYDIIELYCDSKGKQLVENDTRKFPFTNIIVCLDHLDNFLYTELWAYAKIFVYSIQKDPFIHLDLDAFLHNKIPDNIINKSLIVQHREEINQGYIDFFTECDKLKILPDSIKHLPNSSINMGLFGCTNEKGFNFIKEYFEMVREFIIKIKNNWSTLQHKQSICIVFEQLFIASLIENERIDYETILNDDCSNKDIPLYSHFLGVSKRKEINVNRIKKQLIDIGLGR